MTHDGSTPEGRVDELSAQERLEDTIAAQLRKCAEAEASRLEDKEDLNCFGIWRFVTLQKEEELGTMVTPDAATVDRSTLKLDMLQAKQFFDALSSTAPTVQEALQHVARSMLHSRNSCEDPAQEQLRDVEVFLRTMNNFEGMSVDDVLPAIALAMQSTFQYREGASKAWAIFSIDDLLQYAALKAKMSAKPTAHLQMLTDTLGLPVDLSKPVVAALMSELRRIGTKLLAFIFD